MPRALHLSWAHPVTSAVRVSLSQEGHLGLALVTGGWVLEGGFRGPFWP